MLENAADSFYTYFKKNGLTSYTVRKFRTIVYRFYRDNARNDLPWRNIDNPYHILVSEIMLQQTQVDRVLNKHPLFLSIYPDFQSLARTRLLALYKVWQGLGYNRRALALKEIARAVMKPPYNGLLPSDRELLMELPGVGQSTAGALLAFAFNKPSLFIETNIRRVFIYFFFREQERVTDREITPLIERALDRKDPRNWYYALMDYGSALRSLKNNPNLKSTQYKKQSTFAGSNRQMRGKILRLVSEKQSIPVKELIVQLKTSHNKIVEIVDQLCKEGFIKKKGRYVRMV